MEQQKAVATETEISALVRGFYDRVRADPLLGPVFDLAIPDWKGHQVVVEDFWSRVLLGTARYRGCVMGAHGGMRLAPVHFDRWLELWGQSAEATLPPVAREQAMTVARALDQRLRLVAGVPG